jgi:hypothetical protein
MELFDYEQVPAELATEISQKTTGGAPRRMGQA